VLFSDDVYKKLVKLTDDKEVSLSQFIREIVEDGIITSNNAGEKSDEK
jgi:predicted CopG family antitoxin